MVYRVLLITYFYKFNFSRKIENAENLEKSMFSAEFLASLRGFEPPTYRLGETTTKSTSV